MRYFKGENKEKSLFMHLMNAFWVIILISSQKGGKLSNLLEAYQHRCHDNDI